MFWAAERAAYDPETLSIAHHYVGASRSCAPTPRPHRRADGTQGGARQGLRDLEVY